LCLKLAFANHMEVLPPPSPSHLQARYLMEHESETNNYFVRMRVQEVRKHHQDLATASCVRTKLQLKKNY
jgi:hypothetical protein